MIFDVTTGTRKRAAKSDVESGTEKRALLSKSRASHILRASRLSTITEPKRALRDRRQAARDMVNSEAGKEICITLSFRAECPNIYSVIASGVRYNRIIAYGER